ncbi:MAG: hypothetical protein NTW19_06515 [Planctomycetota bacterium]|nr:hypothetical protein [Planctomycetota bacterium]
MRHHAKIRAVALLALMTLVGVVRAQPAPSGPSYPEAPNASGAVKAKAPAAPAPAPTSIRQLLVPFDDLNLLLDDQTQRVLLSRQEYDELASHARQVTQDHAPRPAALVWADYSGAVETDRVRLRGEIVIDVLEDGLHALPLDLSGVGLRSATLNQRGAPIGRNERAGLVVFVQGKGRQTLTLELVAPLQTSAAQQVLNFRVPTPAAARLRLDVPGDVNIRGGAAVVSRTFDEPARVTHLELLPRAGEVSLVMSLNGRTQRAEQAVVARGVVVDEVTQAYERLHASMSMAVLHRPVERFRFAIPQGFEVTTVDSPLMARWAIEPEGERRVLSVYLREPATQTVVITLSAVRTPARLENWSLPSLEPLDVSGYVAVVGLAVEDRLTASAIAAQDMIPVDTAVLEQALPPTVLAAEPGSPRIRPVVAFYAPHAGFSLSARFERPPAELLVTTNLLLILEEKGQRVRGGFAIQPRAESLFSFDFEAPQGWRVDAVTDSAGNALAFERYDAAKEAGPASRRLHVRLPRGLPVGQTLSVLFNASATPSGWLNDWSSADVAFPAFGVIGATRDSGAIAIDARDDLVVRPNALENLSPLDDSEKAKFGLGGVPASLAYRYEARPYAAKLVAERTLPRVTAETYSLFALDHEALRVHSEITYTIERARTQKLTLSVPAGVAGALSIQGLDGVAVKEFFSEPPGNAPGESSASASASATAPATQKSVEPRRRWTVLLAERRSGNVRLCVDFQQRLPALPLKDYKLPMTRAEDVAYQSGRIAIEGSAELDVSIRAHPRKIDVGELAGAVQPPGDRLLGVFGSLGEKDEVALGVERPPGYALPAVIVQDALLTTALSRDGLIQTNARFELLSKSPFLAVSLPAGSTLWAVLVDNKPAKPQREGQNLLLSLPPAPEGTRRRLHLVYETPVGRAGFWSRLDVPAPRLMVPGVPGAPGVSGGQGVEVPVADLRWRVFLPEGYQAVRSGGTLTTDDIPTPELAAVTIGRTFLELGGGLTGPLSFLPSLGAARKTANQMKNSSQVRGIHQGAVIFAQSNNTYLAPDLATLIEGSFISPALILDSNAATQIPPDIDTWSREKRNQWYNLHSSFVYLRGLKDNANGKEIILFTKPTRSDGRGLNIAFGDNHVSYVPINEARELIQAQTGHSPEEIEEIDEAVARGEMDAKAMLFMSPEEQNAYLTTAPQHAGHAGEKMEVALDVVDGPLTAAAPATPKAGPAPAGAAAAPVPLAKPREIAKSMGQVVGAAKDKGARDMLGADSLTIRLDPRGSQLGFQSMGTDPRLSVAVVERERLAWFAWALALAVALRGVALTRRRAAIKARFVVMVIAAATLLPLLCNRAEFLYAVNGAAYAAALLVPYYLVASLLLAIGGAVRRRFAPPALPAASGMAVSAVALLLLLSPGLAAPASADDQDNPNAPTPPALKVPADALILPYDPESRTGVKDAGKILVPYARFVELWNLAHPDKKLGTPRPPAPFAFAGASYAATLEGDQHLLLRGQVEIEVYASGQVAVPLPLAGGVIADATVDGKPARLSVAAPAVAPAPREWPAGAARPNVGPQSPPVPPAGSLIVLYLDQPGRHRLDLSVRLALQRRGGWLLADGRLPAAPATAINLRVPLAQTEVHVGDLPDRPNYETAKADESIATVLGPQGAINLQWRPKVGEGQVDQTLTARSSAVADIQEDGVHLAWRIDFEFRRGERTGFEIQLPAGGLVEKVDGANVRGWEIKGGTDSPLLSVALLKPARDRETFTVTLWQRGPIPPVGKASQALRLDGLAVPGASLHSGSLLLRRSALLELRTTRTQGLTRADPSGDAAASAALSPLGLVDYQAYQFVATPFVVEIEAAPLAAQVSASVESLLKFGERERSFESRVTLHVRSRPIYAARLLIPDNLRIEQVLAPGFFERTLEVVDGKRTLTIHFAAGQQGEVPIVVRGPLGDPENAETVPLPRVEPLGVAGRDTLLAVQSDPAFDVVAEDLKDCRVTPIEQVFGWLDPQQRRSARVALRITSGSPSATLRLVARKPEAVCTTLTNVRVTDRVVEETILLDFAVRYAGIRQIDFLLPAALADARMAVPMLRQKSVAPAGKGLPGLVRVRLELQEELMGQVRVLIESSRLRTEELQQASIPIVETGRTERRFVALEGAGRDEVTVEKAQGLEPLDRQQKERRWLDAMLSEGMTQAWAVGNDATDPALTFRTRERAVVETKGARIGLAQLTLALDESGAYRAEQAYYVDNATEQFLDVELPRRAELWSAKVAGQPVKPVLLDAKAGAGAASGAVAGATTGQRPNRARIPLVKTAPGSPSYVVMLKYAGSVPRPGGFKRVEFPLLRSININVELSQARLYLPPSMAWMRFEGTMTPTPDEGDLVAGEAEYLGREMESAKRDMENADFYVQSRGRFRYETLKQKVTFNNGRLAEWRDNANGAAALVTNDRLLKQVEEQAQKFELNSTLTTTTIYNSIRMNTYADSQRTEHARNQVQSLGSNFGVEGKPSGGKTAAAGPAATQPASKTALRGWLDQNGLTTEDRQVNRAPGNDSLSFGAMGSGTGGSGSPMRSLAGGVDRSIADTEALPQSGQRDLKARFYGNSSSSAPGKPQAPVVAPDLGISQSKADSGRQTERKDNANAASSGDEAEKKMLYSRQLKEQAARQNDAVGNNLWTTPAGDWRGGVAWGDNHVQQMESNNHLGDVPNASRSGREGRQSGTRATDSDASDGTATGSRFGILQNGAAAGSGLLLNAEESGGPQDGSAPAMSATGLASLDVAVPIRGLAYRFTTPRGEVEISAVAVSRPFVGNLFRLGVALAALVVVVIIAAPRAALALSVSPRQSRPRAIATTTLSLSIGATREAGAICRAR